MPPLCYLLITGGLMSESCETVKVVHPDGYAIINKTDFVEGKHELWVDPSSVVIPSDPPAPEQAKTSKAKK